MSDQRAWRSLRLVVVCTDACAIALAFILVFAISPVVLPNANPLVLGSWRALRLAIYVSGWLALLAIYRLYEPEYLLDGFQQYTRIVQASTTGLLLVGLVALLDGKPIPRFLLLSAWTLSLLALGLTRFLLRRVIWRLRRRGLFRARMLVVGAGEDGWAIAEQITGYAPGAAEVVGFLDEYSPIGTPIAGSTVLGEPQALARVAQLTRATDAILVPQQIGWESLQLLLQGGPERWGVQRMWLAPASRDLLTTGLEVHQRGSLPLLAVSGPRIAGMEAAMKRGLDLLLALLVLPVALPVCLAIVVWRGGIRRVAVLERRQIVGRDRRRFTLVTFPPTNDLRLWHLWRLPALYNVLRGDLSFVGPRPIRRSMEDEYLPWQMMLTSVRPGLMGPWWLLSGSAHTSITAEVGLDLAYIRNYTIWSDLRLLALMVRRLVARGHITTSPAPVGPTIPPDERSEAAGAMPPAAIPGGTR
ncbi:MAG TPA: sugar transferase [Ktedonobacterales bacterium]|nr:sugar transferase [Ktedonobacterales bacterium]